MTAVLSNIEAVGGLSHKSFYVPEIDGMRALAVISVMIYHFSKELLPSGYLGVDIFFVISGYVITSSLITRPRRSFFDFLLGFYSRRVKRLMPTLVLCVLITSVLICFFDPYPRVSLLTGLTSLFGLSNIYLFERATNYFSAPAELNVFTQTWSLGIEEQFYFIFPLFIWFAGFSREIAKRSGTLIGIMAALAVASLAAFIYLNGTNQPAAYFLMPARLWELGAGCLLALSMKNSDGLLSGLLHRLPPTAVIAIVVITLFMPREFSVQATIAVVALTVLLIGSVRPQTAAYDVLTCRPVVYVGLISYSLYVWHWSVLSISRWTIGVHWWSAPIQVGLVLLLAMASYHFVEKPFRLAEWCSLRWKSFGYGLGAAVLAAGLLVGLGNPLTGQLYVGDKEMTDGLTASQSLKAVGGQGEGLSELLQMMQSCNMTPHHLKDNDYKPKPLVDAAFIRRCTHSSNDRSPRKVLLVGDSFAQVIARHMAVAAASFGYEFKFINGYGCPYPLPLSMIKSSASQVCPEVDEALLAQEMIAGLRRGDLLVVRLHFAKGQYLAYHGSSLPPVDAYDEAILSLRSKVIERGAQLIVIGTNPVLTPQELATIRQQWFQVTTGNDYKRADDPETVYFLEQDDHLRKIFTKYPGLYYFSIANYLCGPDKICFLRKDGKLLYSDDQHISSYALDSLFSALVGYMSNVIQSSGR